jgi:hypothetical protein
MSGAPHEILVMALRENPGLVATLLERLENRVLPGPLSVVDSSVRFADVKEVRPDLLCISSKVPWLVTEVQHEIDEAKQRRWALLTGVLLDEHQKMGELVVLTASHRVARWARRAVTWTGPLGTRLKVRPVVLEVTYDRIERHLLDPEQPALALVATWALQKKYGPKAKTTLRRALEVTENLEEPVRSVQVRAILHMLNERLLAYLKELTMDLNQLPKSEAFQKFERELEARGETKGEARGEAKALLKYLTQRGVVPTEKQRTRIEQCTDVAKLERWLEQAFAAQSNEALAKLFG